MRGDEHVVDGDLVVQRQIDPVDPVGHGGGHRALVDDHELDGRGAAGIDHRRAVDAQHLQVRSRQHRHRNLRVVDRAVVDFLDRGIGAFVDLLLLVGDDDDFVTVAGLAGQHDLLAPRIGLAGLQRALELETADGRAGAGLAEAAQIDGVGPDAVRRRQALVGDGPGHVDGRALGRHFGRGNVADHQVGRRRQRHLETLGDAPVVVGVDELEGPRGLEHEVVGARNAVGQRHGAAAVVAAVGRQEAQVRELPEQCAVAAVSVGRQVQLVDPGVGAGQADALVAHRPANVDLLATARRALRRQGIDHQIGIGNAHHVEGFRLEQHVVGFERVFENLGFAVGAHEQREAAFEARRQIEGLVSGVAAARVQPAAVREAGQHAVVGVAEHRVARDHDDIGPVVGDAAAVALVGHGPADGDQRRVVDREARRQHLGHRQVGKGRQIHAQRGGHLVVGLGVQLGDRAGGIGAQDQLVVARGIHRQHETRAFGVALVDREAARHAAFGHQQIARADEAVARQVHPIDPVRGQRRTAGVANLPFNLHRAGRGGQRRRTQRIGAKVRMNDGHAAVADAAVVGLEGAFEQLVQRIGNDEDAVVAIGQRRQHEVQRLGVAGTRDEVAAERDSTELHRAGQAAVHTEIDPVGPGAGGRRITKVAHRPAQAALLARYTASRQHDGRDLQVGHRCRRQLRGRDRRLGVVAFRFAFEHQIAGVGTHDEAVAAAQAIGREHACHLAVGGVHRERAAARHLGQQQVASIEDIVGRKIDRVLPAGDVGHRVARIAHTPGDVQRLATARRGRRIDDLDAQVGPRRGQAQLAQQRDVVGARVGFKYLLRSVDDNGNEEAPVELQRQFGREIGAVRRARGQRFSSAPVRPARGRRRCR